MIPKEEHEENIYIVKEAIRFLDFVKDLLFAN